LAGVVPDTRFIRAAQRIIHYASAKNTVPRVKAGMFMGPRLVSALAFHNRKTLVIAGFATEVAVLQTALDARKAGYTVYVAVDATGSRSGRTEHAAMQQMEMAGAIPTSVLAEQGATVVLGARRIEKILQLATDINAAGGRALALQTNVSDRNQVKHLVDSAVEQFGKVDVILNNAGIMPPPNTRSGPFQKG